MAEQSTMLALGTQAPAFELPSVRDERIVRSDDLAADRPLLVIFLCRHCPYVVHVADELGRLSHDYGDRVTIVGISSNDVAAYPEDAPEKLAEYADAKGWDFPVLYDETQAVARAYSAACTPDPFLFDTQRRLAYRGQLDDTRPSSGGPATGTAIRGALDLVLAGESVGAEQRPSVGCSIKWR